MPSPSAQLLPLSGGSPIKSATGPNANGTAAPVERPDLAPSSNPKDLMQKTNSQMMDNTDAIGSMNLKSTQARAFFGKLYFTKNIYLLFVVNCVLHLG